jgi:hypothetical protein
VTAASVVTATSVEAERFLTIISHGMVPPATQSSNAPTSSRVRAGPGGVVPGADGAGRSGVGGVDGGRGRRCGVEPAAEGVVGVPELLDLRRGHWSKWSNMV